MGSLQLSVILYSLVFYQLSRSRVWVSLRSLKSKFRGRLGKHKKVMLKTPFRDNRPNPESSSDGNPETRIPPCGLPAWALILLRIFFIGY